MYHSYQITESLYVFFQHSDDDFNQDEDEGPETIKKVNGNLKGIG